MRNSKLFKLIMMSVMLCSVSAAFASSASAWTTSTGGLSLAATAPASKLTINTASPVGVQCTGTSASGSLLSLTNSAGSPKQLSSSLTLTFTGCTAAGLAANVTCTGFTAAQLWAVSYTGGVTTGEARNVTCSITVNAFPGCKITVTSTGTAGKAATITYNNATFQLTVSLTGQTITATWSNCPFITPSSGSASATFGALAGGSLVYTSTATPKPVITNP